ncbi:hypothetical protein TIFTF001_036846 [Ficus carica]|uniref:Uncharacterized protein n=1 Tax=Ficus carica TaxID=3494 RepID=A0AA88EES2_FICCA|nr:hypothetical protein TIFTF001_036846 [Ficus carica]
MVDGGGGIIQWATLGYGRIYREFSTTVSKKRVVEADVPKMFFKDRRGSMVLPRRFFKTVMESTASTMVFRNRIPPRVFA